MNPGLGLQPYTLNLRPLTFKPQNQDHPQTPSTPKPSQKSPKPLCKPQDRQVRRDGDVRSCEAVPHKEGAGPQETLWA